MLTRPVLTRITLVFMACIVFTVNAYSETVVVLGYGRTGKVFAQKVYEQSSKDTRLLIVDIEPKRLDEAMTRWGSEKVQSRVRYKHSYQAITDEEWHDTVFVQELIDENVLDKQALIQGVLEKLEAVGRMDVPIASNTSSIPVNMLTEPLPEHFKTRVAVNHMYSPHGAVSEVGVVYSLSAASESGVQPSGEDLEKGKKAEVTARTVEAFNERLGIESIRLENQGLILKDQVGHSFNRIWFRIKEHFINALSQGKINHQMADLAFILVYNRPLGIFGTMDLIGLKTAIDIRHVWKTYGACQSEMPPLVQDMAIEGRTFYPPCLPGDCLQKEVHRLWAEKWASLSGLYEYGYEHQLIVHLSDWDKQTRQFVKNELKLPERYPEKNEQHESRGVLLERYVESSPELRLAIYLLVSVTVQEYQHTVLANKVLSADSMDRLVAILTGQSRLFSRLNQYFKDSQSQNAPKSEL